jgi:hypothetical protein
MSGRDRPGHCPDYVPGIRQPPSTYSLITRDLTYDRPDLLAVSLDLVDDQRPAADGREADCCILSAGVRPHAA